MDITLHACYVCQTNRILILIPFTGLLPKPNITVNPEVVGQGHNVTLRCEIPDREYTVFSWYKDNQSINCSAGFRCSEDSPDLHISFAEENDEGNYSCSVTNPVSNNTSDAVELKVYALLSKPNFTVNPEVVEQGHNVTLRCEIADREDTVYSWHKNNQGINCSAGIRCSEDSPDLHIPLAEVNDEGNYSCSVKNPVSNNTSDTVELKVYVRVSKPIVTVTPEVVKEGDNVTLNCNTTAGNHLTYTWYINSSEPKCGDHYECSNESSELIIKAAKPADAGNYSCTAQNRLNNETSDFTSMTVYYGPTSLTLHIPADTCPNDWIDWFKVPEAVCVHENSSLKMSCEAQSLPQSNYSWSFSNATYTGVLIEASEVEMYNFNKENDGNYTCTASNDVTGRDSSQSRYLITYRKYHNLGF
ncbi:carcinoembryonic antigen-related cell adhesion molecule 5-like [Protopterus annectens]|uniref:carcinoembryonic antigen-related cell adhesion molecule 5-like n=1 Tax=Protopterus annectens TaxID=7888 RepID=UPI001CFB3819|nr:carcinoembryonic antigen-related cell adhesion molecule 5-like [Protopterus annectens]